MVMHDSWSILPISSSTLGGAKGAIQRNPFQLEVEPWRSKCEALNSQEASLSMSSLPSELIRAIIVEAYLLPSKQDDIPLEIQVSHVDQRWRHIALNTSLLWSCVKLVLPQNRVTTGTCYLERSRNGPIDLHIDVRTSSRENTYVEVVFLLDVIVSNIQRCHSISVRCRREVDIEGFLGMFHLLHAPVLQSLRLELLNEDPGYAIDEPPYRTIFRGGAPVLKTLHLKGWGLRYSLPPLSGITSLTILGTINGMLIQWTEFQAILGSIPDLRTLVIGEIFEADLIPEISIMSLPSLTTLHIWVGKERAPYFDQLLLAISIPQLENLAFLGASEDYLRDIFVECSELDKPATFTFLRLLTVETPSGCLVSKSVWRGFFKMFPSVAHFTLKLKASLHFQLAPLLELLWEMSADPILPHLRSIAFAQFPISAAFALHSMLTQRIAMGCPIESIHLPAPLLEDEQKIASLTLIRKCASVKKWPDSANE